MIPPRHLAHQQSQSRPLEGVILESMHLCMGPEIVQAVFGDELSIYLAHYPDKGHLVLAPITNSFFTTLHKASQHLLKIRSANGARSIALHELLIDNEIHISEGPLSYEIIDTTKLLKVYLQ